MIHTQLRLPAEQLDRLQRSEDPAGVIFTTVARRVVFEAGNYLEG